MLLIDEEQFNSLEAYECLSDMGYVLATYEGSSLLDDGGTESRFGGRPNGFIDQNTHTAATSFREPKRISESNHDLVHVSQMGAVLHNNMVQMFGTGFTNIVVFTILEPNNLKNGRGQFVATEGEHLSLSEYVAEETEVLVEICSRLLQPGPNLQSNEERYEAIFQHLQRTKFLYRLSPAELGNLTKFAKKGGSFAVGVAVCHLSSEDPGRVLVYLASGVCFTLGFEISQGLGEVVRERILEIGRRSSKELNVPLKTVKADPKEASDDRKIY